MFRPSNLQENELALFSIPEEANDAVEAVCDPE
jgi:hypothetical protein